MTAASELGLTTRNIAKLPPPSPAILPRPATSTHIKKVRVRVKIRAFFRSPNGDRSAVWYLIVRIGHNSLADREEDGKITRRPLTPHPPRRCHIKKRFIPARTPRMVTSNAGSVGEFLPEPEKSHDWGAMTRRIVFVNITQSLIRKQAEPQRAPATACAPVPATDRWFRLEQITKWKQDGLLTESEFAKLKMEFPQ